MKLWNNFFKGWDQDLKLALEVGQDILQDCEHSSSIFLENEFWKSQAILFGSCGQQVSFSNRHPMIQLEVTSIWMITARSKQWGLLQNRRIRLFECLWLAINSTGIPGVFQLQSAMLQLHWEMRKKAKNLNLPTASNLNICIHADAISARKLGKLGFGHETFLFPW